MSIFSTILEKLGLQKEAPAAATPAPAASAPKPAPSISKPAGSAPKPASGAPAVAQRPPPAVPTPKPAAPVRPAAIEVVDVMAKLEAMAAKRPDKLNWKTSIADLLFLLGMDHSFKARKELAEELDCPANLMDDSAKMNTWLHKTVLTKIAENGGNIPKDMLN